MTQCYAHFQWCPLHEAAPFRPLQANRMDVASIRHAFAFLLAKPPFAISLPLKLRLLRELWTDLPHRAALPAVTSCLTSQKPSVSQPVPATNTHSRTPSHRNQAPKLPGTVIRKQRWRFPHFPARKHDLDQKDLKTATIQAAPVIRKVRPNSDQFRCAAG